MAGLFQPFVIFVFFPPRFHRGGKVTKETKELRAKLSIQDLFRDFMSDMDGDPEPLFYNEILTIPDSNFPSLIALSSHLIFET